MTHPVCVSRAKVVIINVSIFLAYVWQLMRLHMCHLSAMYRRSSQNDLPCLVVRKQELFSKILCSAGRVRSLTAIVFLVMRMRGSRGGRFSSAFQASASSTHCSPQPWGGEVQIRRSFAIAMMKGLKSANKALIYTTSTGGSQY